MLKQKIRGFVYFENKKIEDVERVFANFRFDDAKFKFFKKFKVNNKEILEPGVFLNGQINEKYTSENVVRLFRKLMGLSVEKINAEISIEREDEVEELDKERNFLKYYSLEFKKTEIKNILDKFKEKLKNGIIYRTRDTGYREGILFGVIEIFAEKEIDEELNNILLKEKIFSERIVRI